MQAPIGTTAHWTETYREARALVLGASGFIGRWVSRLLADCGSDLRCIVRDAEHAKQIFKQFGIHCEIVELDLLRFSEVADLVADIQPMIVFNLAGYGVDSTEIDAEAADRINARLVEVVCGALAKTDSANWPGRRLVHTGSAAEYGAIGGNLSEQSEPRPTTRYGESKLRGTQLLARCADSLHLRAMTARLFTVYGPGEHSHRLLPALLEASKMDGPFALTSGTQQRDFTYVTDVAEGLLRLGAAPGQDGEVVNLATGRLITVRRFAETAARLLGIGRDRLHFGALDTRPGEMAHRPVTIRRLRDRVCWSPQTGIVAGIKSALEFARREHS
jgi:nucleoside-diphosphate-sugar epimerase